MHLKIYKFVKLVKTDVIIKFHANYCKLNDTVRTKKKVAANRKVAANKEAAANKKITVSRKVAANKKVAVNNKVVANKKIAAKKKVVANKNFAVNKKVVNGACSADLQGPRLPPLKLHRVGSKLL